jgi:hypothetical protein
MTPPRRRLRRHHRRPRAVLAAVGLSLLLTAGPVAADPARPTHYQASVTGLTDPGGKTLEDLPIDVSIAGGDAFVVLRVAPGTTVEVPGYQAEPYLRITADGSVEVNERSPARWLNDARYGARDVEPPPQADPDAPPSWEVVAAGGTYAWHDHRVHVMSPALPPQVDPHAGTVQPVWDTSVPLVVDGQPVTVEVTLVWVPGPSAGLAWALVLLAAAAAVGLVLRFPRAVVPLVVVAALAAGVVGVGSAWDLPPGSDVETALTVLPALALVLLASGAVVARRRPAVGGALLRASALPVAVWGLVQAGALVRPVVPGGLPVGGVRAVTVLVLAVAVAVAVDAARRLLAGPPATSDPDVASTPTEPSPTRR